MAVLPLPRIVVQEISVCNKEPVSFANIGYLSCNAASKYMLCFVDDIRCERLARSPWSYVRRLKGVHAAATPDLSVYQTMPLNEQFLNVYWSRLTGCIWQMYGIRVIPTISWSSEKSFSFCFKGIRPNMTVTVSTLGTRHNKAMFMAGFQELCKVPNLTIICYDEVYSEMWDMARIIPVKHDLKLASCLASLRQLPGQMQMMLTTKDL
jgi:hypothetical protein